MIAFTGREVATTDSVQAAREAAYRAAIDEEFRRKGGKPIHSVDELRCDGVFDSDEELAAFLADLYASRGRGRDLTDRTDPEA